VRSSNGGQRGDKRAHNSIIKVSFCTIIIRLSLHDSNHDSVVRIFVALLRAGRFILHYIIQVATALLVAGSTSDVLDTSVCIHQLVLKYRQSARLLL